jgi:hypothetical protein
MLLELKPYLYWFFSCVFATGLSKWYTSLWSPWRSAKSIVNFDIVPKSKDFTCTTAKIIIIQILSTMLLLLNEVSTFHRLSVYILSVLLTFQQQLPLKVIMARVYYHWPVSCEQKEKNGAAWLESEWDFSLKGIKFPLTWHGPMIIYSFLLYH